MARLTLLDPHPVPRAPLHDDDGAVDAARSLKIGDLAKAAGKSARALRLYEEMGLLTPGTRTAGGFRLYGVEAIERVHWIGKLQELGFTLQHIQELVEATQRERVPKEAMGRVRGMFLHKLDDVAAQIARLSQLQRELMSSLSYLEACHGCGHEAEAGQPATTCCRDCGAHEGRAPGLVDEITRATRA